MILIREKIQQFEEQNLSSYAMFSKNTQGREVQEQEDDLRTPFQRDRDRVIHCKAFRRLKHKTQVFLSPEGDHYRTRLTHTLEVTQIARTIARALFLNEDLVEAIGVGHDLGHTPFGHAGERALNEIMDGGFRHYEQSVRVVEKLEKNGRGLNLTKEVRDGILCHTKGQEAMTLEGRIIRYADRIAYINHDIDDAERAGVLSEEDIPQDIKEILGKSKSERINTLVVSLVKSSGQGVICMEPEIQKAFDFLHDFMFERVYFNPYAKGEERKVPELIEILYTHLLKSGNLPKDMQYIAEQEGQERAVCDYIAGMTDHYAVQLFQNIFVPKAWNI